MDLVLLIGVPAVLGAISLVWHFWFKREPERQPEATVRRREDARDWQRRFGTDSLLTANFLQPTQNEILETLYILDHLTPGWETHDAGITERRFLDELALNFPTLRKAACGFPLPFAESLPAQSRRASGAGVSQVSEAEIAARREKFRVSRAHPNALEQIVSGPVDSTVIAPGSPPFRFANITPHRRGNPWLARLAVAAALGAIVFEGLRLWPNGAGFPSPTMPRQVKLPLVQETTETEESSLPDTGLAEETPTPSPAPPAPEPLASPVSAPVVTPSTALATNQMIAPPAAPTPDPHKTAQVRQIAASKQRALAKYPSLAVEGSEINLRFVFRYKILVQQNSPRLLKPNWPEELVEECAADSASSLKRTPHTQTLATHH